MATEPRSDTFDIGSEVTVHRLGFGAMRLTGENIIGRPDDPDAATDVLNRAVDLGINFFDTADSYGPGVSERLIREGLHPYPDELVIATKGGLLRNRSGDWIPRGDPDYLRNALLCSLDRLGVDEIDLYQYHRPDPDVPFADSIATLAELKDDGLINHIGLSNVDVAQLDQARDIVEIATVQNKYNVATRDSENVLEACENANIGFIPWSPIGAGSIEKRVPALESVAEAHGATHHQIALAWLLQHSPVMLPIPGTSSIEHLEENAAAADIELSEDEYRQLRD